jgi:predicted ribonuclease YlaK
VYDGFFWANDVNATARERRIQGVDFMRGKSFKDQFRIIKEVPIFKSTPVMDEGNFVT